MYIAKKLLKYNGTNYAIGDEVPLSDKEADYLIKARVIEAVGNGKKTADKVVEPEPVTEEPEPMPAVEPVNDYTAGELKKLTKAQLVKLAAEEFGLDLSVRSKEAELITAILDAQARE